MKASSEKAPTQGTSLIVDISNDATSVLDLHDRNIVCTVEYRLRVSVVWLENKELFVYLASIETIDAIVDENPGHFCRFSSTLLGLEV